MLCGAWAESMAIPLSYNLRSAWVRKATTIATIFGIAAVVFVLASVLMLVAGIQRTLKLDAREDTALVLSQGAASELESTFDVSAVNVILGQANVRRDPAGVAEMVIVAALPKAGTDGVSNVGVRGISEPSVALRPQWKIIQGRNLGLGKDEVVIGRKLVGRFHGLSIGQSFELKKNRPLTVVGVFEDNGSSNESEVWVDHDILRTMFGREGLVSSVRVRLASAGGFDAFRAGIEHDKRLGLKAWRETDYADSLSAGVTPLVAGLGGAIAFFFSAGAILGAMITMYAAVANRTREIGTLRALGFSRTAVLTSFVTESVVLTLIGGGVGVLAALPMKAASFSILTAATWSEVVFTFQPTARIILSALACAALMGLLGGFLPALRASRIKPADAMRVK